MKKGLWIVKMFENQARRDADEASWVKMFDDYDEAREHAWAQNPRQPGQTVVYNGITGKVETEFLGFFTFGL